MVCRGTGKGGEAAPPSFHHSCGQNALQSHSNPPQRVVAPGRIGLEPQTIICNLTIHSWNSYGFVICKTPMSFTTSLSSNTDASVSHTVPQLFVPYPRPLRLRSRLMPTVPTRSRSAPAARLRSLRKFPAGRRVLFLPIKTSCQWFDSLPVFAGSY